MIQALPAQVPLAQVALEHAPPAQARQATVPAPMVQVALAREPMAQEPMVLARMVPAPTATPVPSFRAPAVLVARQLAVPALQLRPDPDQVAPASRQGRNPLDSRFRPPDFLRVRGIIGAK